MTTLDNGRAKRSLEEVTAAIRGSSGIKTTIARTLGVNRHSVDNYLKRWPSAQLAYDQEIESVGDLAESVIIAAIRANDVETAKWYARMKLKNRGYAERSELTGKDGAELVPIREVVIMRASGSDAPAT